VKTVLNWMAKQVFNQLLRSIILVDLNMANQI